MPLLVGTSGWQYRHWRERFYPRELPQARWLEHYAERFAVVEVNNTFYRLPEGATFESWAKRTPGDFLFALKMSRYLTHIRRLKEPAQPLALFMERARLLGRKLGPLLLQLPGNFHADAERLREVLAALPNAVRVAAEFRHESWFSDEVFGILEEHDAALCLADSPRAAFPARRTAGWGYLRLHEGTGSPPPCYERRALREWARRLAGEWDASADLYVFFNNDGRACALADAVAFCEECARAGIPCGRVPARGEIEVG